MADFSTPFWASLIRVRTAKSVAEFLKIVRGCRDSGYQIQGADSEKEGKFGFIIYQDIYELKVQQGTYLKIGINVVRNSCTRDYDLFEDVRPGTSKFFPRITKPV